MRRAATVALVVLSVLTAVPVVVRLLGDSGHLPWVYLAVAAPFTVVPLAVLAAGLGVLRRGKWVALPLVPLLLVLLCEAPLFVGSPAGRGAEVTVMSANLRFGGADPFRIVQLVRQRGVDVLATQELTSAAVTNLRGAGLETELPYFTGTPDPRDGPDGSGIWSRWPLTPQGDWPLRFDNPGAVVRTPSGPLLVRCVHLVPPVTDEKGVYRRDYRGLLREVRALPTTGPAVVVGDFNATLDNSLLREVTRRHWRDAGEAAGSGLLRTWGRQPGSPKVLWLDHVLVDPRVGVRGTSVADLPGSDHAAFVAKLVVR